MAAPRGAIESVEGGFKVVFFCGGQQYEVQHLRWAEEAVLVCDLLTMKEAIDGQLNLKALQLRSQHLALLTVQQLRDAVCTLRGSELRDASVAEVVEQLQACVLEAPMGASRICLLRGAAQLGLTSIAQLLRVADPQAVLGKCTGPARSALAALLAAGPAAQPLFADFVIARLPMTSKEWATVPAPCPGIGRALPAVLAHPAEQARWLVRHLPPADAQRLRTAAFSLHRAQQQLHVFLPSPVVWDILALSAT
ncbi:hypothetical protein D9Q98_006823 [Chlorella vulgaris]|uniref:Uncharacterized protein n=1 Tax=Chlorella vulgaris TaxID=3077 RepID=A0A9D4TIX3_CHLVU|nr:hypothetical protein D9Q98_006823 [Chlorella vulgaris]